MVKMVLMGWMEGMLGKLLMVRVFPDLEVEKVRKLEEASSAVENSVGTMSSMLSWYEKDFDRVSCRDPVKLLWTVWLLVEEKFMLWKAIGRMSLTTESHSSMITPSDHCEKIFTVYEDPSNLSLIHI